MSQLTYAGIMRSHLVALVVVVTLGVAPSTANAAHAVRGDVYSTCMKKGSQAKITTSKGSKEVRLQIQTYYAQVQCRFAELQAEFAKKKAADAKASADTEANRIAAERRFDQCLRGIKMTKEEWTKRYFSKLSGPCVTESMATWQAGTKLPILPTPWSPHNAWLDAIRLLYNLAKVYPDSVRPEFLAPILELGDKAGSCRANGTWCYSPGKS